MDSKEVGDKNMKECFASEFTLIKDYGDENYPDGFHVEEVPVMVSSVPFLSDHDLLDWWFYDHVNSYKEIESLDNGVYHVFAYGTVEYEPDIDWETGHEEGEWIFDVEKFLITPYLEGSTRCLEI